MTRKLTAVLFVAILALFTVFASSKGFAQAMKPALNKLDGYLSTLNDNNKMMAAVYVSRHGDTLYQSYTGLASVEADVPISANTKFRIGSITKTFTSVLIRQLVEAGKLSLGTTLDTFYPDIANAKDINIKQMLNHRSGIKSFTGEPVYSTYMTQAQSRAKMEQRVQAYASEFTPGSQHR